MAKYQLLLSFKERTELKRTFSKGRTSQIKYQNLQDIRALIVILAIGIDLWNSDLK